MTGESSVVTGPAEHKLALEVEKLQIEVAALRKPRRWNLTSIAAAVGVVATVGTTSFQYRLNQIKQEQTVLDLARLEKQRTEVQAKRDEAQTKYDEVQRLLTAEVARLESTNAARQAANEQLAQLELQLKRAEAQLASSAPGEQGAAARAALVQTRTTLGAATAAVQQSSNSVDAYLSRLQMLQHKVGVYFLTDSVAARRIADQVRDALASVAGSVELYPRDRAFFETVNLPAGDEVRYEAGREDEIARSLAATLQRLTSRRFTLRAVGTPTPNFVSVMIAEGL